MLLDYRELHEQDEGLWQFVNIESGK